MSDDRCHVVAGTLHPCSRVARVLEEGGDTAACFRWLREDAGEVLWCLACGARIEGVRGDDGATTGRPLAGGSPVGRRFPRRSLDGRRELCFRAVTTVAQLGDVSPPPAHGGPLPCS